MPSTVHTSMAPLANAVQRRLRDQALVERGEAAVPSAEPHDAELLSVVKTTSGQPEPARSNSDILVLKVFEPLALPS